MKKITHQETLQIQQALLQDRIASCVAAPGAVSRGTCVPPTAAGSIQAAGAATSGSVLSVLIKPYTFTLLHLFKSGLLAGPQRNFL